MFSRLCSPPTPVMGLSNGEQSLCRVPPSPVHPTSFPEEVAVHPHEGAPMRSCCNFFIFEAKCLICSLVGAILLLSRFGAKFVFVLCCNCKFTLFVSKISKRVELVLFTWYQFAWNSLQLEFSVNDRFKAGFHLKAVFTSLNVGP